MASLLPKQNFFHASFFPDVPEKPLLYAADMSVKGFSVSFLWLSGDFARSVLDCVLHTIIRLPQWHDTLMVVWSRCLTLGVLYPSLIYSRGDYLKHKTAKAPFTGEHVMLHQPLSWVHMAPIKFRMQNALPEMLLAPASPPLASVPLLSQLVLACQHSRLPRGLNFGSENSQFSSHCVQ